MNRPPASRVGIVSRALVALAACAVVGALIPADAPAQTSVKVPKQCAAARNRVAQQQKAIADDQARIDRETKARFACGSTKACRRHDKRIESIEERRAEHVAKLVRLQEVERKACPPV
jgi:hypothetical protein